MKRGILVGGTFVVLVLGFLTFASAAASSPTGLVFSDNATAAYDEGNFSLNWTAGSSDVVNYSIYVFAGSTLYLKADNDSATGYLFSNTTEANYTFVVEALNSTNNNANSTNTSIYVDRTAPVITLPVYVNATAKKNTLQVTLNVSVSDAGSGLTGSQCLFDINGTNESVSVSSGWCNSTALNLTGLTDGNQTIKVYVNDTVGIFGLNNSFAVLVDTTAPAATPSCSPSTIQTGDSFPCTCSGTDSTAGLNSSLTSGSSTSGSVTATSSTGVFTYTCSVTDLAGNLGTATATYTVTQPPTTGSSSGSSSTTWVTHSISDTVFSNGYTSNLSVNNRLKVSIGSEDHYVGVLSISTNNVDLEISSNPVQASLSPGEDGKFDVDGDGFYDIHVTLNSIEGGKANLTVQKIHEEISSPNQGAETGSSQSADTTSVEKESKGNSWIWILIVVLVLFGIWKFKSKK